MRVVVPTCKTGEKAGEERHVCQVLLRPQRPQMVRKLWGCLARLKLGSHPLSTYSPTQWSFDTDLAPVVLKLIHAFIHSTHGNLL